MLIIDDLQRLHLCEGPIRVLNCVDFRCRCENNVARFFTLDGRMRFRVVLEPFVAPLKSDLARCALIRHLTRFRGVRELVHLERPRFAELRRATGEVAFVSNAQVRGFNVPVEMRLLLVLVGAAIARILPLAGVISLMDEQVASTGEFLVAARLVALHRLAEMQSGHVSLERRVLREGFVAELAAERPLLRVGS